MLLDRTTSHPSLRGFSSLVRLETQRCSYIRRNKLASTGNAGGARASDTDGSSAASSRKRPVSRQQDRRRARSFCNSKKNSQHVGPTSGALTESFNARRWFSTERRRRSERRPSVSGAETAPTTFIAIQYHWAWPWLQGTIIESEVERSRRRSEAFPTLLDLGRVSPQGSPQTHTSLQQREQR